MFFILTFDEPIIFTTRKTFLIHRKLLTVIEIAIYSVHYIQ